MMQTIAFDIYGTLIDTQGIVAKLHAVVGDKADDFSRTWRDKQLEYCFRKGLMHKYESFAVCTKQALNYTCEHYKTSLPDEQKNILLSGYNHLSAFKDVRDNLLKLKANHSLYAFSNGTADAVQQLLLNAGIGDNFLDIISVDELETFKPNPEVYHYLATRTNTPASDVWLVSSNPFDVIGAISAGLKAVWVQRSKEVTFDPWDISPTITVNNLFELEEFFAK